MSNAVRARGGEGNRVTGLVDTSAIKASAIHYSNSASVVFSGTDEYIVGPSMDSLATFTNKLSVSIWFRWEVTVPPAFRFLTTSNSAANLLTNGWGIYWHTASSIKFFIGNWNISTQYAISNTITDLNTEWHHVLAVYDGDKTLDTDSIKIYVDGVVGTNIGTATLDITSLTSTVSVGRGGDTGNNNTHYMRGHADEMAIWDVPLSADEVTAVYNAGVPFDLTANASGYTRSADLKLHWRLGELDTNTTDGIHDASGNDHTATMTNMEDEDIDTTDFAGI